MLNMLDTTLILQRETVWAWTDELFKCSVCMSECSQNTTNKGTWWNPLMRRKEIYFHLPNIYIYIYIHYNNISLLLLFIYYTCTAFGTITSRPPFVFSSCYDMLKFQQTQQRNIAKLSFLSDLNHSRYYQDRCQPSPAWEVSLLSHCVTPHPLGAGSHISLVISHSSLWNFNFPSPPLYSSLCPPSMSQQVSEVSLSILHGSLAAEK